MLSWEPGTLCLKGSGREQTGEGFISSPTGNLYGKVEQIFSPSNQECKDSLRLSISVWISRRRWRLRKAIRDRRRWNVSSEKKNLDPYRIYSALYKCIIHSSSMVLNKFLKASLYTVGNLLHASLNLIDLFQHKYSAINFYLKEHIKEILCYCMIC